MTTATPTAVRCCTLPGCDGAGHDDGADRFCCAQVTDFEIRGAQISLDFSVEVYDAAWTDGPQMSVFAISGKWDEAFLHRTTSPADAVALAERFEELAATLRRSAVVLAGLRCGAEVAR